MAHKDVGEYATITYHSLPKGPTLMDGHRILLINHGSGIKLYTGRGVKDLDDF